MKPRTEKAVAGSFYGLVTLWFAMEYLRPGDYAAFLGTIRPSLILLVIIFLVWLARGDKSIVKEPMVIGFGVFIALGAVSVFFARNNYWAFQNNLNLISYLCGGVLPFVAFMDRAETLKRFFTFWVGTHALVAALGILNGGRGSGGFLGDENDLALTLAMAMPFAYFLAFHNKRASLVRTLFIIAGLLMIAGVVATRSRGGFLGMMMAAVAIVLFSRNRVRNLIGVAIVATIGALLVVQVGLNEPHVQDANSDAQFRQRHAQSYMDEMRSIQDAQDATRVGRIYFWGRAWEMFHDHPIFGVGTSNFPWMVEDYENSDPTFPGDRRRSGGRVAHSLYFTLLAEYGVAGSTVFVLLTVAVVNRLGKIRRRLADVEGPEAEAIVNLSRACSASLFAFLVAGAFLTVVYYPHFWYLLGFAIAMDRAGARLAPETAKAPRFGRLRAESVRSGA